MSDDILEESLEESKAYQADSRIACQYGSKCYQKNPQHHEKYKHPPKVQEQGSRGKKNVTKGRKRTIDDTKDGTEAGSSLPKPKHRKDDVSAQVAGAHSMSPSPTPSIDEDTSDNENEKAPDKGSEDVDPDSSASESKNTDKSSMNETVEEPSKKDDEESTTKSAKSVKDTSSVPAHVKSIILKLFLVEMPNDFYQLYDFCCKLSPNDPSSALKVVDLKLVGPYDVLCGKVGKAADHDKEKYLKHWRYFYDPPEFQTILKGNDKEGLHYGYWRDVCEEKPVFVAKNSANKDCKIIPVAPNIFGAVQIHVEERLKFANPFDKAKVARILQTLKSFAKEHGLTLEKTSAEMRSRDRKVVTKTFHGAGIVVPYDKKTQLGYRDLAATESHLRKLLQQIDKSATDEKRNENLATVEEVVRLATIAADECDFGTPLELGHDLFSSGVDCIQNTALMMLTMAYNLLKRPQFLTIAVTHMGDRKKGCNLSVL